MKQYNVTGMSCAACSARVEKAVSAVDGVSACSVNLLTNSMGVEGSASDKAIIDAVKKAGYGAFVKGERSAVQNDDEFVDTETPKLKRRLILSLGFLIVLMYVSMGHSMWGWPLPILEGNYLGIGLLQMCLSAVVMIINNKFFVSGFKGIINKVPNMDTLVAMGSGASFIWSVYVLFNMTAKVASGDLESLSHLSHEFYFESAAMIVTLITVGKMLEAKSKGKTTNAIKALMKLRPEKATVIRQGEEITIDAADVLKGDIFLVRPGESVPVDGVVIEGHSAVNESALTGESIPVDKAKGDKVSASTVNQSGLIKCEAIAVGEDTALSQIIKMVSDAAATKAPIAKIADKVSGIFVPTVITIAIITGIIWLIAGEEVSFALARAISVLVISCPCALGLATPVAIMVSSGMGAKNGILFKTAEAIEKSGKIQIVALDKTGTITKGEPEVTDVLPSDGISESELIDYAYSLEKYSEHPLAKAVTAYFSGRVQEKNLTNFTALPGKGAKAYEGETMVCGGNLKLIEDLCVVPKEEKDKIIKLSSEGKTPLIFAKGDTYLGTIFAADVIKPDSAKAISEMKNMGIHVVMLTGDNESTARAIGEIAGADEIIAGVLPEGKERVIRELSQRGIVAMVGDGINDAPALTRADIGIAIGSGTDIAIDAGDIVLMKSSLSDVPKLLRLSRRTLTNIHENLFWAFFYNALGIPLAAGAFIPLFGWTLTPMFGAAAMSLSSFCVVSNALRLNLADISSPKHDRKIMKKIKKSPEDISSEDEKIENEMIIEVKGMMCEHCEKRVKDALKAVPGIKEAYPDFTTGKVRLILSGAVDVKQIKKAVKKAGYNA